MNIFEAVGAVTIVGVVIFVSYINLVAEPACEAKGYASASVSGCLKTVDGVKVYELCITQ